MAEATITVLLFARYADLLGQEAIVIPASQAPTVGSAVDYVRALPGGNALPALLLVAVNLEQVGLDRRLDPDDEVALLPPDGGWVMDHLTRRPIDVAALIAAVQSAERGAVVTFVGVVRDHHQGKPVIDLEYSGYEPMVERVAAAVVAEASGRWPVQVGLVHRLGRLAIGEPAVAVAVGSGHRDEAFAACRYVIEEVKRRVPIWKRERYLDGSESWVDPTAPEAGHSVLNVRGPG